MGDIVFQLFSISFLVLPTLFTIFILIFVIRMFRRMEKRAEERLMLDKEYASFQQEQMKVTSKLNERLTTIERMLKEVD